MTRQFCRYGQSTPLGNSASTGATGIASGAILGENLPDGPVLGNRGLARPFGCRVPPRTSAASRPIWCRRLLADDPPGREGCVKAILTCTDAPSEALVSTTVPLRVTSAQQSSSRCSREASSGLVSRAFPSRLRESESVPVAGPGGSQSECRHDCGAPDTWHPSPP